MAAMRWSSDFAVEEYRDIQANSVALDCTGNRLLLPSRRLLAVKDIKESIEEIQIFPRISKYEIVKAAWNPHIYNKDLCALCSGTNVEIISLTDRNDLNSYVILKWHTRTVTDVDWHPVNPNILISSSVDTFTHIWDIREPKKPVVSFSSFAGATHAKWNRLSRHLLATTHAGDIKIWDERKNSSPVQYITAHLTTIHSIDWSPVKENHITTGSQDGNIKIFDISDPQKEYTLINPESPVWKVCYAPFGKGNAILGVMVPEIKKTENTLLLWHLSKTDIPLHTFVGHTEIVLDFTWRTYKQDVLEYQLITWAKDQTLRIWEIDKHLITLCSQDVIDIEASTIPIPTCTQIITSPPPPQVFVETRDTLKHSESLSDVSVRSDKKSISNPKNDTSGEDGTVVKSEGSLVTIVSTTSASATSISSNDQQTIHTVTDADKKPKNLQQELAMDYHIRNTHFDKMDPVRRLCSITVKYNCYVVVLLINFPPSYPKNKSPIFRFTQGTTINSMLKSKLLKILKDIAEQKVKNHEVCLESCLTQLVNTMEQTLPNDPDKISSDGQTSETTSNDNREAYVLIPRTCGAKFCHVGSLVCFLKPNQMVIDNAISGLEGLTSEQSNLLSTLYLQSSNETILSARAKFINKRGLLKRIRVSTKIHRRIVTVYDLSSIFLVNRKLAEKYVFTGPDVPFICNKNAQIAASIGRKDLLNIWKLVALSATTATSPYSLNSVEWEYHPFSRDAMDSIIRYYVMASDIQTAAMLCCVFSYKRTSTDLDFRKEKMKISNESKSLSPYHTIHPVETSAESSWNFPISRQSRSNSWSESLDELRSSIVEQAEIIDTNDSSLIINKVLKDDEFYEKVKILYATILDRWALLVPRTLVMKRINTIPTIHRGIQFSTECSQCKNSVTGTICPHCRIPSLVCVICRLSVKGAANFCFSCGHGGHTIHMNEWFRKEKQCPSGCKCYCLLRTAEILKK